MSNIELNGIDVLMLAKALYLFQRENQCSIENIKLVMTKSSNGRVSIMTSKKIKIAKNCNK